MQLLDLHGKQSYLLCDITKAYDRLVSMDTLEGYSPQVMDGRVEVLNLLKESALLQDGKVQDDKGLDLPMRLLPSALALLAQVGRLQENQQKNTLHSCAKSPGWCKRSQPACQLLDTGWLVRCSIPASQTPLITPCCPRLCCRLVRMLACMSWHTRPWQMTA